MKKSREQSAAVHAAEPTLQIQQAARQQHHRWALLK
jgi:hypothetical protein